MKNELKENWFKIGILLIISVGIIGYLKHIDESNVLRSRIEYAECKGKLGTVDQRGLENKVKLDVAIFEIWNSACDGILSYK